MALSLSKRDPQWNEIKYHPAAAVADNFVKMGRNLGADAISAAATDTIIAATAHGASANDLVMFYEGGEESEPRHAASVTTDQITLNAALSGTPSEDEGFVTLAAAGTDDAEASSTTTNIKATGHAVTAGDLVWMTEGGEVNDPKIVASINANDFTLNEALGGSPSAGEAFSWATPTSTGAVESGTTDTVIEDDDHDAVVGDLFVMTTGGEINELRVVISADGDSFTLNEALSGTPTAAETYALITPQSIDAAESGNSDTKLFATAHGLEVGDEIIMTNGGEDGEGREITSVGTDWFIMESALSGSPSVTETFHAIRPLRQSALVGARYAHIHNSCNQPVEISFDGTTVHHILVADEEWDLPSGANNLFALGRGNADGEGFVFCRTFQSGSAPTTGAMLVVSAN
jgi:hypothetical protein